MIIVVSIINVVVIIIVSGKLYIHNFFCVGHFLVNS